MSFSRLPQRDPRTVAREIPGVLDILFPRLSGGLVTSLNKRMFRFPEVTALSDLEVENSKLQSSLLFEIAMARTEEILIGVETADWTDCIRIATDRQKRHFDAHIPEQFLQADIDLAELAARNLVKMLESSLNQHPSYKLLHSPIIPGLGWVCSGNGDFSIGPILIEVKHTDRNFVSGDFRQVLMYWILKYISSLEGDEDVWSACLLLNPRRNSALLLNFDYLLNAASPGLNRLQICDLMRSVIGFDTDRNQ